MNVTTHNSMETNGSQRRSMAVPGDKATRDEIRRLVRSYAGHMVFVPPLPLDEIEAHAAEALRNSGLDPAYRGFASVLVGNEVWRKALAATPYDRRILLLPQCLRSSSSCRAEFDALGLLCEECGQCPIGGIQREAEALGYVILIAEGTTAVSALLARGSADAVVGVSCLQALERSFRHLTAHAIPGVAVPLIRNGCVDTAVDLEWVREAVLLRDESRPYSRLDIRALHREVGTWFESAALQTLMSPLGTSTEAIAVDWLAKAGKRWRPLLSLCVYKALLESAQEAPETLKKVAVAVECFHKASLVHDDIEDNDDMRYGEQTLHRQHGTAIALNAGDLLIGEGYRLIAESGAPASQVRDMIAAAAEGHCTLCLGQGEELLLRQSPDRVSPQSVLEIFRRKTAPAFEVALQLGAICAGADADTRAVLTAFSEALGVAYQIRDDLDDLDADHEASPGAATRPSLLVALARENLAGAGEATPSELTPEAIKRTDAETRTRQLLQHHEDEALRALHPLRQASLKSLLYRVAAMILHPPSQ